MKKKTKKFKLEKRIVNSYFEQMLKIYPLIASVLEKDLASRDDDNILCVRIWKRQGIRENMSFKKFKYKLIMNKIASPETIGRSRRRLQEKNVSMRGSLYKQRHAAETTMRNQMKMDL